MRWFAVLLMACAASRPSPRGADVGSGALARWSRGEPPRTTPHGDDDVCVEEDCLEEGESDNGTLDGELPDDDGLTDPPPDPADDYTASSVLSGGTITGRVLWTGHPRGEPTAALRAGCDAAPPAPLVQRDGAVTGAVVYLEQIVIGKPPQSVGGVLTYRRCVFSPRVQIAAPIGALVLVANDASGAVQLEIDHVDSGYHDAVSFSDGRYLELPLGAAGFYRFRSDRAWPAGQAAWVIVPRHPYFVVTGENGQYSLQDVPAGAYTLVVWHPPADDGPDARPLIKRVPVRVQRARITTVNFDLGRR